MMYNWNIDICLKSGVKLECFYCGIERNTLDVANKLFAGKSITEFVGLDRRGGNGTIYFMVGEAASYDIYK